LCRALGYDLNTVEFACEDGIPYAIDFMNPAPDADVNSVGQENFDWIVNQVADLAVRKAKQHTGKISEYRWSAFLHGAVPNSQTAVKNAVAPKTEKAPEPAPAPRNPGQCLMQHLSNYVSERAKGKANASSKPEHRDRRGISDD
jgi:hypothetical protein